MPARVSRRPMPTRKSGSRSRPAPARRSPAAPRPDGLRQILMPISLPRVVPAQRPVPARAGIGLRARHHDDLLRERPDIGWLDAHSGNYFADGGAQLEYLLKLR